MFDMRIIQSPDLNSNFIIITQRHDPRCVLFLAENSLEPQLWINLLKEGSRVRDQKQEDQSFKVCNVKEVLNPNCNAFSICIFKKSDYVTELCQIY